MAEKLKTEVTLETRQGRTVSRKKQYYLNGNLHSEGVYSGGHGSWDWDIPVGLVKKYYSDGVLKSEEHYNDHGEKDGEFAYYDSKGRITSKTTYIRGKKTAEAHFNELGQPTEAPILVK